MNKKGNMGAGGWIAVVVIALVAIQAFGIYDLASLIPQAEEDTGTQGGVTSTTPKISFACIDTHSKGTSVTCNAKYKINGNAVQYDADASGIEVSVGDKIEYIINASSYYAEHGTVTMPDKNVETVTVELLNWDTDPSVQVYCQDDGLLNAVGTTEALAANAVDTLTIKYFSTYKDGIKGAAFNVDYNRDNIDDITSSLSADISEPDSLTHNSTTGIASNDAFRTFTMGDINANPETSTSQNLEFTISVDVGSSAYGTDNMTYQILDQDWYIDSTGGFAYGAEEPVDNVDQGQKHHSVGTGIIYTAST